MNKLHVDVFHEMILAGKAVIRTVWGTSGIEGLTPPQFAILMHLNHRGHLSPTDLSDALVVTQGNITGLIERLRKQGLVDRHRSATDRRVLKIAITAAGIAKLEAIRPIWEKMVKKAFTPLTPDDQKSLKALLHKLWQGLSPGQTCLAFPGRSGPSLPAPLKNHKQEHPV